MPDAPHKTIFTAREIGQSAGLSRFAVRRALAGISPTDKKPIAGNLADAWAIKDMPQPLRDAFARGPLKAWQPPIPVLDQHPKCISYATQLRSAFAPTFAGRYHDDTVSDADLATAGVADYRQQFGHSIHPRHWQRLLDRITTRDSGLEEWDRLAIYLPEESQMRRKPMEPRKVPADMQMIMDEFNQWADPLKPTFTEEKQLFVAAFTWLQSAIKGGCAEVEAKKKLIPWLQLTTGLSTNEDTLRRVFNAKLQIWRVGGDDALKDGRKAANAARRTPAISEADEKLLVSHAAFKCDGFIATAWRECYHQLSPDLRGRYSVFQNGTKRKDYVPSAIVKAIGPKVAEMWKLNQGAGHAKMHGAFIPRDWSGLHTGDIFSTDDATLEVYGAVAMPEGGFKCIRGQFFPWVDEKSKFVFSYSLLAKEHFHAHDILAGLYDALETLGVPRKKLRTENGIFKRSRWLGRGEQQQDQLWTQSRECLTDRLGIEWTFTQPRNPRGKIVENILRLIIRRLAKQSMFVGRHEQVTAREEVAWAIREVNSGRQHPHAVGMFLFDEWERELENVVSEYNNETQQDSVVFGGTMSPADAFEKFLLRDGNGQPIPLSPFPREVRLMLSVPRRSTVGGNGIRTYVPGSKSPLWFDSVKLSERRNEVVLVRIDPGNLDEILVTDLKGANQLLVPRLVAVPANDPTPDQMHAATASIEARSEYGKRYFRSLRPASHPGFQPVTLDASARNALVEINDQRTEQAQQRRTTMARRIDEQNRSNRNVEIIQDFLK